MTPPLAADGRYFFAKNANNHRWDMKPEPKLEPLACPHCGNRIAEALRTFAARAAQPGFDRAPDDSTVTFFAKDVREARAAFDGGTNG